MSDSWSSRSLLGFGVSRSAALALLGVLFVAACSDDGCNDCSCGGFVEGPYPANAPVVQLSGQVRVTPTGLNFVEDNLDNLVAGAVPGGLSFCIPGGDQICHRAQDLCSTGEAGCDLTVSIDSASIEPQPPNTLNVSVTIGDLNEELPLRLIGTNCIAKLEDPANSALPGRVSAGVPVTFSVDPITQDVQIELGELALDMSQLKIEIDPAPGSGVGGFLVCEGVDAAAGISFVREMIYGQLTPTLQETIDDLVGEQLCRSCDPANPCDQGSTCNEGVCRYADDRCVPRKLGMEGRFLVGDALADFTEHPEAAMDLVLKAADHASVNDGVIIGLRSGFEPDTLRRCVPSDPTRRPDDSPIPLSQSITGNLKPNGQPFMFGFGYHKKAIQHLLWSVWGSGATCLMVTSDSIDSVQLSTGLFTAFLPSLRNVVSGSSAIYIKIVPQEAPDVILGQNQVMASGDTYTITDPLIDIDWKDMDIHIYAFGQERWTRLFTLRGDLNVPIAIVPGDGVIEPIIGDLSTAISNVRPIESELVSEDEDKLIALLPTLLGAALPALAGSLIDPIELPDLLGLELQIQPEDITSVDNGNMIAIYANLAAGTQPYRVSLDPIIRSSSVRYEVGQAGLPRPVVDLEAMAIRSDGALQHEGTLEFAWRVDQGLWSHWISKSDLSINDPVLVIPGEHIIEIRARYAGQPDSQSSLVSSTQVVVDWDEPRVEIERDGSLLRYHVEDTVEKDVDVRWRLVGEGLDGDWSAWSKERETDLSAMQLPDPYRIDVEAKDREGRVAADTRTVRGALQSAPATSEPKTGCSAAGGMPLWLLLFVPLMLRRRRRRGLLSVLLLVGFLGACSDDTTTPQPCASCPDGTYCGPENTCVEGCSINEDCATGEVCSGSVCISQCEFECATSCGSDRIASCGTDNVCACTDYCDGGCEDGSFCCRDSNSCQLLLDPCDKEVCDVGFGPVVVREASGDSQTCEIDTGMCECQPLPPLPLGFHGHYLSIDQAGSTVLMAVYNSTYTDLMVGAFGASDEGVWTFVDGLPETGDVVGDLNGPRGGIRDRGPDAGTHTALAVDASGVAHIFYRHTTDNVMKYARGTGSGTDWSFETRNFDGENAGFYPDAIVVDGTVHVVYMADNIGEPGDEYRAELRHATFPANEAFASVTATPEVVTYGSASHPCGGRCGTGEQCFVDASTCARPATDCGTCADGTACYEGACVTTFSTKPESFRPTTGLLNQLQTTPDGLIVAFYDHALQSVAHARFDGTTWTDPTYVGPLTGPYVSALVDDQDGLHLAYMDPTTKRLVYQPPTGAVETIADGLRDSSAGWIVNDIGEDVTLRFGSNGEILAVYHDATRHILYVATRSAAGAWTSEVLAGRDPFTGSHGFFAALLRLPSDLVFAAMTYYQTADPPSSEPLIYRR